MSEFIIYRESDRTLTDSSSSAPGSNSPTRDPNHPKIPAVQATSTPVVSGKPPFASEDQYRQAEQMRLLHSIEAFGGKLDSNWNTYWAVQTWLTKVESALETHEHGVPKVTLATHFLDSTANKWALAWLKILEEMNIPLSEGSDDPIWDRFISDFKAKYINEYIHRQTLELFMLRQTGSVEEYTMHFRDLALIPDFEIEEDPMAVAHYYRGLSDEIQMKLAYEVDFSQRVSFHKIVRQATRIDEEIQGERDERRRSIRDETISRRSRRKRSFSHRDD